MTRIFISIFIVFFGIKLSISQEVLTLDQAKSIATQQSYLIKLSENEVGISQKRTQLQQTGHKPVLGLISGVNGKLNSSNTKYFQSPESTTNWVAPSIDANIAVSGSYLLWDAHKVDHLVNQSVEQEQLAQLSLKSSKEDVLYRVESAYLNLSRLFENKSLLQASMDISRKRKLRASYGLEYGTTDRLSLLNAEVDMNRDSVNILKYNQQIINAKRRLNLILNRNLNVDFIIEYNEVLDPNLSYEMFYQNALTNNLQLKQVLQRLDIIAYDKKINDANLKPVIKANASYGINYFNNSDVSPIDYSLGDGLKLGLSANWNLSDGGRTKHLNQISDLNIAAVNIQKQQLEDNISLEITNAWGEYQNALLVYNLEQENLNTANENFVRTEEKFKSGQVNSITFRQAQLNFLLAKLNLSSAKYDALLIVLDLKQLSGVLLEDVE